VIFGLGACCIAERLGLNLAAVISVPQRGARKVPPPPAEPFTARIFLGPALRTQPDRRLVRLVREGYEGAFEEIVRRYRKPLDRFAAGFVGNRSEDVTQDAFSKALLALRGSEKEIELRPWLYRIVRNTALNDLRDGPPPAVELGETAATGPSAAVEAERREEIAELIERLQALPEPQRAAIVMRELEGLSHEEIAAGLGISGGAARQAIHRARTTLRDGLGLLVPLPLLRLLFDQGADAAAGGAAAGGAAAAAGATAATSGGATLGGIGAVGALKVGLATAVLAGSVGAGVAVQHNRGGERRGPDVAAAATFADDGNGRAGRLGGSGVPGPGPSGARIGSDGGKGRGGDRGRGSGGGHGLGDEGRRHGDRGRGEDDSEPSGGPGPSDDGRTGRSGHPGHDGSSENDSGSGGGSGSSHSGRGSGSGDSDSGRGGSDDGGRGSSGGESKGGSGSSDSSRTSGGSGSGGGEPESEQPAATQPSEPAPEVPSGSGSSGSGSSGSSGGESGSSGGSGSSSGSGSSGSSGGPGDDS
jgi:RNA polymerase sigma factor (sigma-70 family)